MNAENSTGHQTRLPLSERAARGLLAAESELSLSELLILEHPVDKNARQALGAAIRAAVAFGDLRARQEQQIFQKPRLTVRFTFNPTSPAPQYFETVRITTVYIDRESYRAWRAQCPAELLSPLSQVHKWLCAPPESESILLIGSIPPAIPSLPESELVANGGAAEKTAALKSLLAEIDERAAEKGAGFNRHCLPGTKAEFQKLLNAYCPAFRYIGLPAISDYLKGECKFQRGVNPKHRKGAAVWALFPEYPDLKLG